MRTIEFLVVHCTATPTNASIQAIQNYWKNEKKWENPGYHILIDATGKAHSLLPIEQISNGVLGYNSVCLHVAYIGGFNNQDTRTLAQKTALLEVLTTWKKQFPKAKILGHRNFPKVQKACPCFDAEQEYQNLNYTLS